MKYTFDCVVIGAGIAGMTAAIYLKRANVNVLLLDNDAPGGLLNKINLIENYPGFTKISGPDLAYNLYEQVQNLGIEIRYGKVIDIDNHNVITDIETISCNKIIIAIGRRARKLDNTNNLSNVSYCVTCDANLYKDKTVAIVVNNETINDAIYLANICNKVIVLSKEKIDETKIFQDNIEIYSDCVIKTLKSENNILKKIITENNEFEVSGLFISMGYEPNSEFLNLIEKDNNYILVNNKMQTNIDYIFACGDIIKKDVYQLTTAAADATIAALNVKKELMK